MGDEAKGSGAPPSSPAHDLYAVAPPNFVEARDALARGLRAEGRKDEAAELKKRRRPSPVVWALNQLGARRPDELARLVDLTAQLGEAHASALDGDKATLRRVRDARHEALASVAKEATSWLATEVGGAAHEVSGVSAALDAALLDPAAAEQLQRGELDAVPSAGSAWDNLALLLGTFGPSPPAAGAHTRADTKDADANDDADADAEAAAAAAAAARVEQERRRAQRKEATNALAAAEKVRQDAARRMADLRAKLDEATEALAAADAAVRARAADLDRLDG
ncbi:MAG: uncharacterized protein JWN46_624 [Acidimicrobiales bacterium]|nr:uncharacterized protein [Acidimicrobiales bacterium]